MNQAEPQLFTQEPLAPAACDLSVVIPVYRSAATLPLLCERLAQALGTHPGGYEIVFVEDCGNDGSWAVIRELAARMPHLRGIRLARNFGQHNALLCGVRAARGRIIITMDDDLQHRPEDIGALLARLDEGYDVVYGYPAAQPHTFLRGLASEVTKMALASIMGIETARHVSAFRALRASVRDAFSAYRGPFVSIDVLLTWGAGRFSALEVQHDMRQQGVSNYTVPKLINHALNMLTGFSVLPLRIASLLGFACTLIGVLLLAYVLVAYLVSGTSVPGFPFLASMIAVFSGAQLFALGMIGEYLSRIHFRTMDRPPYVVAETTGDDPPEPTR